MLLSIPDEWQPAALYSASHSGSCSLSCVLYGACVHSVETDQLSSRDRNRGLPSYKLEDVSTCCDVQAAAHASDPTGRRIR